jgi:ubiquinone/menaquinone biosynthesis C-methylase UbiE
LPFPNRSVDYVYSAHFLEHLTPPAPIPIFQEINRVATDGAHLEFWTPFMWHNAGFIFGHTQYYNEDHYMHLCVWFSDFWQRGLGARWLLKEFVYVVEPEVLIELYKNNIKLDFAIKYYKGVVKEFGVIIEVRHDYKGQTIHPKRTFTTERNRERHLLRHSSKTIDKNELQQAINWFSGTE